MLSGVHASLELVQPLLPCLPADGSKAFDEYHYGRYYSRMPRPQRIARTKGARALRVWLDQRPEMTQEKLAEQLAKQLGRDVRQTTVSKWLGDSCPELAMAIAIEAVTGIAAKEWTLPLTRTKSAA